LKYSVDLNDRAKKYRYRVASRKRPAHFWPNSADYRLRQQCSKLGYKLPVVKRSMACDGLRFDGQRRAVVR
jgi:hypothetical protein